MTGQDMDCKPASTFVAPPLRLDSCPLTKAEEIDSHKAERIHPRYVNALGQCIPTPRWASKADIKKAKLSEIAKANRSPDQHSPDMRSQSADGHHSPSVTWSPGAPPTPSNKARAFNRVASPKAQTGGASPPMLPRPTPLCHVVSGLARLSMGQSSGNMSPHSPSGRRLGTPSTLQMKSPKNNKLEFPMNTSKNGSRRSSPKSSPKMLQGAAGLGDKSAHADGTPHTPTSDEDVFMEEANLTKATAEGDDDDESFPEPLVALDVPPVGRGGGRRRIASICIQERGDFFRVACPRCCMPFDEGLITRILDCNHTFCQECLVEICIDGSITCPRCYQKTSVEVGGVESLRPNYALGGLSRALSEFDGESVMERPADVLLEEIGATCPICMEGFVNGHHSAILSCGHSLCHDCLKLYSGRGVCFECPICRMLTSPSHGEVNECLEKAIERILSLREERTG